MDKYLDSSWEEFQVWVRSAIGPDFRWKVRPLDNPSNRKMIAGLIQDAWKRNNGVSPKNDAFIERIEE